LLIVAVLQLLSVFVAKRILKGCAATAQAGEATAAATPVPIPVLVQ
jgi:hypothetical protein